MNNQKGFGLAEILVASCVIALIVAILLPNVIAHYRNTCDVKETTVDEAPMETLSDEEYKRIKLRFDKNLTIHDYIEKKAKNKDTDVNNFIKSTMGNGDFEITGPSNEQIAINPLNVLYVKPDHGDKGAIIYFVNGEGLTTTDDPNLVKSQFQLALRAFHHDSFR